MAIASLVRSMILALASHYLDGPCLHAAPLGRSGTCPTIPHLRRNPSSGRLAGPESHTFPWPSSLNRSDGSARCRKETRDRLRQLLFCRSDTSYTYANAHQARRALLLRLWKQRTQDVVIVRFSNAQPADLASAGRGALVIIDQSDA